MLEMMIDLLFCAAYLSAGIAILYVIYLVYCLIKKVYEFTCSLSETSVAYFFDTCLGALEAAREYFVVHMH